MGGIRVRHAWLLRRVFCTRAASGKADCMNIIGFVVSSILIFQSPSYSESKGTSACKRPLCDRVTCVKTSWIFSLAPSPRMTFAHPPRGGRARQGSSAVILVLVAYKFQRVRPRSRPRCVAPPSSIHVCMTGHVLFTALDKSKAEKRSCSRHAAAVTSDSQ